MAGLAVSLSTFSRPSWTEFTRLAREAEDAGFSAVLVPEANNDVMLCCHAVVRATSRVTVGSRIANVYLRAPLVCAAGAAMLQEESDGRFLLGLGAGHRTMLGAMGIAVDNARQHLRGYASTVRRLLETGEFAGLPYRMRTPPKPVPIYIAALSKETARLAGEIAGGLMLYMCTPARMRALADAAREAAVSAGRDPARVTVTMGLPLFLDEQIERAYEVARQALYFYASLPFYNRSLARDGFAAEASAFAQATSQGDRAAAEAALTPRLLDAVALIGPANRCAKRIAEYRRFGAELPVLVPHAVRGDYAHSFRQALKAFAGLC